MLDSKYIYAILLYTGSSALSIFYYLFYSYDCFWYEIKKNVRERSVIDIHFFLFLTTNVAKVKVEKDKSYCYTASRLQIPYGLLTVTVPPKNFDSNVIAWCCAEILMCRLWNMWYEYEIPMKDVLLRVNYVNYVFIICDSDYELYISKRLVARGAMKLENRPPVVCRTYKYGTPDGQQAPSCSSFSVHHRQRVFNTSVTL